MDTAQVAEDGTWGEEDPEDSNRSSELRREWDSRRNHFHTLGYRDGITAGKESQAQEGFNEGFKKAVTVGYNWGVARGAVSALTALTPALKERLSRDRDAHQRVETLNVAISGISSDEAMRRFFLQEADEGHPVAMGLTPSEEGSHTAMLDVTARLSTGLAISDGASVEEKMETNLSSRGHEINTSGETSDAGRGASELYDLRESVDRECETLQLNINFL